MNTTLLEDFLLNHLRDQAPISADPVQVARAFQAATEPDNRAPEAWHRHLSAIRRTALRLAEDGRVEVLRKGRPVPAAEARGVIRLRLPSESAP